ncbi:MAG: hypothetical protein M1836_004591 [Candelina mexicana]|nr:MAG: hypothetical protein M1836_004591 [Candelina mexicana]
MSDIKIPSMPRANDAGRLPDEYTIDKVFVAIFKGNNPTVILENTLAKARTQIEREMRSNLVDMKQSQIAAEIYMPKSSRIWKDMFLTASHYAHSQGSSIQEVVSFVEGEKVVEIFDATSALIIQVPSYGDKLIKDLKFDELLSGALELDFDALLNLELFARVWRTIIINDYADSGMPDQNKALAQAEGKGAQQAWAKCAPKLVADDEKDPDYAEIKANIVAFSSSLILPGRKIDQFNLWCQAIALLNPLARFYRESLFTLFERHIKNHTVARVPPRPPHMQRAIERANFLNAMPYDLDDYWNGVGNARESLISPIAWSGAPVLQTCYIISVEQDSIILPSTTIDFCSKAVLFIRFVEHVDILNPGKSLEFSDYVNAYGKIFSNRNDSGRAKKQTESQEVKAFFGDTKKAGTEAGGISMQVLNKRQKDTLQRLAIIDQKIAKLKLETTAPHPRTKCQIPTKPAPRRNALDNVNEGDDSNEDEEDAEYISDTSSLQYNPEEISDPESLGDPKEFQFKAKRQASE